ncbi:Dynamin-related protein 1E [Spatholobus suberectus]|nr:Dynamin-related protein 1E [Spatholobus suberectus]
MNQCSCAQRELSKLSVKLNLCAHAESARILLGSIFGPDEQKIKEKRSRISLKKRKEPCAFRVSQPVATPIEIWAKWFQGRKTIGERPGRHFKALALQKQIDALRHQHRQGSIRRQGDYEQALALFVVLLAEVIGAWESWRIEILPIPNARGLRKKRVLDAEEQMGKTHVCACELKQDCMDEYNLLEVFPEPNNFALVRRKYQAIGEEKKWIQNETIVSLTFTDLHGLTKVAVEEQFETIVQDIENMIRSYVEKVIMFLSKSDEEISVNRKLAKELVDKW